MGGLSNELIPDTHVILTLSSGVGRCIDKAPFQIAAKRLEIDDSVNRTRLISHLMALNIGFENRSALAKAQNE